MNCGYENVNEAAVHPFLIDVSSNHATDVFLPCACRTVQRENQRLLGVAD